MALMAFSLVAGLLFFNVLGLPAMSGLFSSALWALGLLAVMFFVVDALMWLGERRR
jgi:hypothetical protein